MSKKILVLALLLASFVCFVPQVAQAQYTEVTVTGTIVTEDGGPLTYYPSVTVFRPGMWGTLFGYAGYDGNFTATGFINGPVDGTWDFTVQLYRALLERGTVEVTNATGAIGTVTIKREVIVSLTVLDERHGDGTTSLRWIVNVYRAPGSTTPLRRSDIAVKMIVAQPTATSGSTLLTFSRRLPKDGGAASDSTMIPRTPLGTFVTGRLIISRRSDLGVVLSDSHGFLYSVGLPFGIQTY